MVPTLLLNLALAAPQLELPTFIASSMALQRAPLAARLWGWAAPGSNVTATLDSKTEVVTSVGSGGNWTLDLPPQPAGLDHTIVISDGVTNKTITDVAFGDVWLCSGQSNMEFSVNNAFNASAEIAASAAFANVRLATVAKAVAATPQAKVGSKANYSWARAAPSAFSPVGVAPFSWFSAACWFFGRDLYTALNGQVPIGLVASDWGGQTVQAFSSQAALDDATCGGTQPGGTAAGAAASTPPPPPSLAMESLAMDEVAAKAARGELGEHYYKGRGEPNPGPMQLWNAMIHPLVHMRFVGATWYQGEANAGDPDGYACRFPAMIADWRRQMDLPELTFLFVQLAAFHSNYAPIRAAQLAALHLPKVGFGTAIDTGDPTSPYGSIHPRRKQEVGRRLSLAARSIQYGETGLVSRGPTFIGGVQLTDGGAIVSFELGTAEGLHLAGSGGCSACCAQSPFEAMNASGAWVRAPATLTAGNTVELSTTSPILGLRFAWEGYPQCALYNGVGGPDDHRGLAAPPFQWCAYGTKLGQPDWLASCEPRNPLNIYFPTADVPSAAVADFALSGGASVAFSASRKDGACSGLNIRTGNPGGVGIVRSKHAIVPDGNHTLDSVALAFRYVAGYTPPKASPPKKAPVVTALLTDSKGVTVASLGTSPPLGNYSYDIFTTYSPPVALSKSGLNLGGGEKLYVSLHVLNNERNLQLAVDDLVSGWNVSLGWK